MSDFISFDLGQINVAVGLVGFCLLMLAFSVFWVLNLLANKYVTSKIESHLKSFFMWLRRTKNVVEEQEVNAHIDKQIYELLKELRIKFNADRVALMRFKNSEYYVNQDSVHKLVSSHVVFSKNRVEIANSHKEVVASTIFENYLEHIYTDTKTLPYFVTRYKDCNETSCDFIKKEKDKKNAFSRKVLMYDVDDMDNCTARFILKELDINFRIQTTILTSSNKILGILCVDYANLSEDDKEIIKDVEFKSDTIPSKIIENISICNLCRISYRINELLKNYK